MNKFTNWCFRIGLVFLALTFAGEIALFMLGFDTARLLQERSTAVTVLGVFIQIFMWMGIVLLVEAIVWLKRNWHHLSKPTKITSTLALLITSILGSYVFHWLLPDLRVKVGGSESKS